MQETATLLREPVKNVNTFFSHSGTFSGAASETSLEDNILNNKTMRNRKEEVRVIGGIPCRLIEGFSNAEILARVHQGETLIAIPDEGFLMSTFSVQSVKYNGDKAVPVKNFFIHCHKRTYGKYLVLVPVSLEERQRELNDRKYANEWKKRIPKEYY